MRPNAKKQFLYTAAAVLFFVVIAIALYSLILPIVQKNRNYSIGGIMQTIVIQPPAPKKELVFSAVDFGVIPENTNNQPSFQKAILQCKLQNCSKLVVPKGVYRFDTDQPLLLEGLEDVRIDGQGSEFIFSKQSLSGSFFEIKDCRRVEFSNFYVDWDWSKERLATVGKVLRVGDDASYFEMEFPELNEANEKMEWLSMNPLDPKTLTPGVEKGQRLWTNQKFKQIERLSANVLRLYPTSMSFKLQAGEVYLIRHFKYGSRVFNLVDGEHLTFDRIVIYSGPGMGWVGRGDLHHWKLQNCAITLRPGSNRRLTTAADGLHVQQSKGYFLMENCDFSFMGDDGINYKDNNIATGITILDEKTIQVKNVDEWRFPLHKGDFIEFRNPDLSPAGFSSAIVSFTMNNSSQEAKITFAEPLLANIRSNSILFNKRYDSGHYVIRNNYFHEHRARGMLVQAGDGVIEENKFYKIQGAAIQIEAGTSRGWSEGMGVENVLFRNNKFDNCDVNDWGQGVVYMSTYLVGDKPYESADDSARTEYPIFKNIRFENNTFIDFPRLAFFLSSCDGLILERNLFRNPTSRLNNLKNRGEILLSKASNLRLTENKWVKSPYVKNPASIKYDDQNVKNIQLEGNSVVLQ